MNPVDTERSGAHRVGFVDALASYGDRPALITAEEKLTYRELAADVATLAESLGATRRLVLVIGSNTVPAVLGYLGALAGGHAVMLVSGSNPTHLDGLIDTYDPDVVIAPVDGEWTTDVRRDGSAHELNTELALTLSTSGTTGSPKVVRLSHENLQANAASIAEYLVIRESDRAITTLPLQYSYGLSVVNSHLLRGAAVVLTELSVVDTCFWDLVREHEVGALSGVPYTFELLDRVGFAEMDLPHLRTVTQAGGRLAPDDVVRYAQLGQTRGWDFFVMYGETEATARMAYLPPALAERHPQAIGVPIPGGTFRLDPLTDADVVSGAGPGEGDIGELVYSGPNVMLGYAENATDLARGRDIDELRTGDIARRLPEGLHEIVGRRSRFAKVLGLRVDLQRVEALLDDHDVRACCLSSDDELVVVVERSGGALENRVPGIIAHEFALPEGVVRVIPVDRLPRTPNGKPDHTALRRLAEDDAVRRDGAPLAEPPVATDASSLRDVFATVLRRPDATVDDTFVTLGGDSLSYVEMSLVVEQALGHLPNGWHITPIHELAAEASSTPRTSLSWWSWQSIESSVALRAAAILTIVGTHVGLIDMRGGSHILLAMLGFNFARFQLSSAPRTARLRSIGKGLLRVVVPTLAWVGMLFLVLDGYYRWWNVALVTTFFGPREPHWNESWEYWFIEVLVYFMIAMAALFAIPAFDRLERHRPFALPFAITLLALLTRYEIVDYKSAGSHVLAAHVVFWLFALGWATARASEWWQRALLSLVAVISVVGFFDNTRREATVAVCLLLLIWVPTVRLPRVACKIAAVLASAALYIYLTHWLVVPLREDSKLLALVACLVVGLLYWKLVVRVTAVLTRTLDRRRDGRRATVTP